MIKQAVTTHEPWKYITAIAAGAIIAMIHIVMQMRIPDYFIAIVVIAVLLILFERIRYAILFATSSFTVFLASFLPIVQ